MKHKISSLIIKFVGTAKGAIVNTVIQEPVSTSGQIGQIEGLVVDTVTQEPVSTKGQVEEIVAGVVRTVVGRKCCCCYQSASPTPNFVQMEEDNQATE